MSVVLCIIPYEDKSSVVCFLRLRVSEFRYLNGTLYTPRPTSRGLLVYITHTTKVSSFLNLQCIILGCMCRGGGQPCCFDTLVVGLCCGMGNSSDIEGN